MACDPNFADVSLLLHCDGTNGSTSFPDVSNFNHTMTSANGLAISTAGPKFGTGAALITANNQSLTTPITPNGSLDLNYQTSDFTVEGWISPASGAGSVMSDQTVAGSKWSLSSAGGGGPSTLALGFSYSTSGTTSSIQVGVFPFSIYNHFAVVCESGVLTGYMQGVAVDSITLTNAQIATFGMLNIGASPVAGSFNGMLDEIRISQVAQYTSNFTPPTAPFLGSCAVIVPNVVGEPLATAESSITAVSLIVGTIAAGYNSTVPSGSVVSQSPVGGTAAVQGDSVNLVISAGPAPFAVPVPARSTGTVPTTTGRALPGRPIEGLLMREAQSCLGPKFASSTYKFFLSGTTIPANVYMDGFLTTPFPAAGVVSSNQFGRFPPIYLDPSVIYRVQFFNSANVQQWQQDPYIVPLSTVGTSSLSAFGFSIAQTGEVTLDAPNSGGTGVTLTLNAGGVGSAALNVAGTLPGASAIIVNSSATTGTQTATFAAANKPGTTTSAPVGWLPITCDGVQYYTPLWFDNDNFVPYVVRPGFISIRNAGSSGVETVPMGASFVAIAVVGAGGGGSSGSVVAGGGGGGGGGAFSVNVPVTGGNTFNFSVALGGAGGALSGATPANTTVTGVGPLSAVVLAALGGGGASSSTGGSGGTASGGNSQNVAGVNGGVGSVSGGTGGASAGADGGNSATGGVPPGGVGGIPGGGGAGAGAGSSGGAGGGGIITFVYS
jgi:hypothetical protein